MKDVPVCHKCIGWPTKNFFKYLDRANIMGVKAGKRLEFEKSGSHRALNKGAP